MPSPSPAAAVPASGKPAALPGPPADSPAEAQGRRILSTAFVNIGPGGHLSVELRDGRALVLRDVVMRARDYCGVQVAGGAKYCGGYADVATARPGAAPVPSQPETAASNPREPGSK